RPEKEHTPLEGMDNEQIKRFALFLFEENQNKSKQLDEIGKDLKEANRKIDSLTDALLKANSKAEKAAIECKL
ncbi:IS66 family transposase, partial [Phocaeicola coprocola]|nr:IS66 family transposase [Phocaeicola coprocola]